MMSIRNVLFIMCDQLRFDHLGCTGHPYLRTRNLDWLASRGISFRNAFVQAGVCGPSRMSFYTGRYPSSHGATWNGVPLPIDEMTLGEYLHDGGRSFALAGKTHWRTNVKAMRRLAIDGESISGRLLRTGGFVEIDRYDGHVEPGKESGYGDYLRASGYTSVTPWNDFVTAALNERGEQVSGHRMRNIHLPARVAKEHSETAYITDTAIEFLKAQGDEPWALHLSYIKPHWPYITPAPYHSMYRIDQCLPVSRHPAELERQHPVLAAYRQQEECVNFMRDEVIDTVRPRYTGLVQEIDDQIGRVWEVMEQLGRWRDTLVIFTSDHGDFLGDHWLGEKEQFYDTAQRVPFLLYDPDPSADATRGTSTEELVETIDTVPTILDALGLPRHEERVEGQSLLPFSRGSIPHTRRDAVFSELDYSFRSARLALGRSPGECRAWMVRTADWKYVYWLGYPPQLFDLRQDPDEFFDLRDDASLAGTRASLHQRLCEWFTRLKRRTTLELEEVEARTATDKQEGIFYGVW